MANLFSMASWFPHSGEILLKIYTQSNILAEDKRCVDKRSRERKHDVPMKNITTEWEATWLYVHI